MGLNIGDVIATSVACLSIILVAWFELKTQNREIHEQMIYQNASLQSFLDVYFHITSYINGKYFKFKYRKEIFKIRGLTYKEISEKMDKSKHNEILEQNMKKAISVFTSEFIPYQQNVNISPNIRNHMMELYRIIKDIDNKYIELLTFFHISDQLNDILCDKNFKWSMDISSIETYVLQLKQFTKLISRIESENEELLHNNNIRYNGQLHYIQNTTT